MCVLCCCKAFKMSTPVLTLFFSFFCTRTHIPGSPACVMFSCAKVAADHHPQSGSATVGGSTRYACFVITPPKPSQRLQPLQKPPAAVDCRFISPKIVLFFYFLPKLVRSKTFRRVTQSAETSRGVHWKDLVRRGAVVLISPQSKTFYSQKAQACWVMTCSEVQFYLPSFPSLP